MRLPVVAAVVLALAAAAPAGAKDGVVARVAEPTQLANAAGEVVTVEFTLRNPNGRPFSALGVFVRLRSATSGDYAEFGAREVGGSGSGRFAARAVVPEGADDVVIGLEGTNSYGRSDALFPIANDPFPGDPPAARAGSAVERATSATPRWPFTLVALAALLPLTWLVLSRRQRSRNR